ncbi:class I adenylate-forming enzyme family protein [Rhizobium sp. NZLR11]|uniref:class I adenylate-forming enzyme family protein n=1 Tax=Rhizobium sp. NZLR11 TaxID=2731098 RepID=UPI001C840128|nr:class I adenylate-forming enzyme family protein [Rhizobium sp. NZLR11]MBX5212134.1 acyl--CoA ligase [Rhizobium sp. NZLR11]
MFTDDTKKLLAQGSAISLGDVLETRVMVTPQWTALEYLGHDFAYGELNALANQCAWSLLDLGIEYGEAIVVLSENTLDYLSLIYGAAKTGVAVAGCNYRLAAPEVARSISVIAPRFVFVSASLEPLLREAMPHYPAEMRKPEIIVWERNDFGGAKPQLSGSLRNVKKHDPRIDVDPEQVLVIVYTSGTTGAPKGAALSHRAIMARAGIMCAELHLTEHDHYVAWHPLFHMSCSDYVLITHVRGGKVFMTPRFDAGAIADFCVREKIGWLFLVPGVLDDVAEAIKATGKPVAGVKYVGCMADLSPVHSLQNITEVTGAGYFNTFGTTEVGTVPSAFGTLDLSKTRVSFRKVQSTFSRMRIVDAEGKDCPCGTPGEILYRTPTLFSGYWNNDKATNETMRDGWYHSGDVCVLYEDGTYDFLGRSKYMIKSGGESIYPAEVEHVLLRHPNISEVQVIRVPDEKWSEVPAAYIATHDGEAISVQELNEFCTRQITKWKVPKYYRFISTDEFPRNVTGKIERPLLEKMFAAGQLDLA